jgi:hypothetical protein
MKGDPARHDTSTAPELASGTVRWLRWSSCLLLIAAVTMFVLVALWSNRIDEGKDLFTAAVRLEARMSGHETQLPVDAARCRNCHGLATPAGAPGSAIAASRPPGLGTVRGPRETFGPVLSRQTLEEPLPRRGGPPSRYDRQRFCRVLREGIDPAHVMLPQTMPRYTLTEQECTALWTYVTAR